MPYEMFEAAENREFDVLVFWSLDNFSWKGIRKTISYLQQLEALGVEFRSYTKPYLNTENELVSHILLAVRSYFAEYEAKKISCRRKLASKGPRKRESRSDDLRTLTSTETNLKRCSNRIAQKTR